MRKNVDFSILKGKTLTEVVVGKDNTELVFITNDGERFRMYHSQDCCESVSIDDIDGDFVDLIGSPILVAEEVVGETAQPVGWKPDPYEESFTWTFYKLDTAKGGVTIRWFGSSNGYYSESVDFECEAKP